MMKAAIEIHDAGIVAGHEGARSFSEASPGYALFDGASILVGRAARRRARLLPLQCDTWFWDRLDTASLPRPFPAKLRRADLACAHLGQVFREMGGDPGAVILLVPGWFSTEALALLLGIARALSLPVSGLLDSSFAAAMSRDEAAPFVHLDIHLHRAAAALVAGSGEELFRDEVLCDGDLGLVALENAWATLIAEKFLRETRFDPLHLAASEQRLYDGIPELLKALRSRAKAAFTLDSDGKTWSVDVSRDELVRSAIPYYGKVAALASSFEDAGTILVSHHLDALPGMSDFLAHQISRSVVPLARGTSLSNVLRDPERFIDSPGAGGALVFRTHLGSSVVR
jgi:hypothetical protein